MDFLVDLGYTIYSWIRNGVIALALIYTAIGLAQVFFAGQKADSDGVGQAMNVVKRGVVVVFLVVILGAVVDVTRSVATTVGNTTCAGVNAPGQSNKPGSGAVDTAKGTGLNCDKK